MTTPSPMSRGNPDTPTRVIPGGSYTNQAARQSVTGKAIVARKNGKPQTMQTATDMTPQPARYRPPIRLGLLLMLLSALQAAAATCSVCGKQITGQYFKTQNGDLFCSRECLRKTLPVCAACGRRIEGPHLVHDGKPFCSEACFETILPTCEICGKPCRKVIKIDGHSFCEKHGSGERCHHCGLPFGQGVELPDGRLVCNACKPKLVFSAKEAQRLYQTARQDVRRITGFTLEHVPPMELVGTDQLPEHQGLSAAISVREYGRYHRSTTTVTKSYLFGLVSRSNTVASARIVLLYGLSSDHLTATAAHELTHHLIAEAFPRTANHAPPWLKEGLCQYVAAQLCIRNDYRTVLKSIEQAPDAVYGEGYRYIKRKFGHGNWRSIAAWLQTVDFERLPKTLPQQPPGVL